MHSEFFNTDKTRKGVAIGKKAFFFTRPKSRAKNPELKQFWKINCISIAEAMICAEDWALNRNLPRSK